MQWSDEMNVGMGFMDQDHTHAAALITKMAPLEGTQLEMVLGEFISHCEYHFAREEDLMEKSAFFAIVPHREEHRRVLENLRILRANLNRGETKPSGQDLSQELENWLINHRNTMDQATAAHALSKGITA